MKAYYLTATTSDLTGGNDFNLAINTTYTTAGSATIALAKGATETSYGFTSALSSAQWNYGIGTVVVTVTTANAYTYLSLRMNRIDSVGNVIESSSASSEQLLSATGTYTFAIPAYSWTAGSTTDRLRLDYIFRNSYSMSTASVVITTNSMGAKITLAEIYSELLKNIDVVGRNNLAGPIPVKDYSYYGISGYSSILMSTAQDVNVCKLTETDDLVAYRNASARLETSIITHDNTRVTSHGSTYQCGIDTNVSLPYPLKIDDTHVLLVYKTALGYLRAVVATINGTVITYAASASTLDVSVSELVATPLNNGVCQIFYAFGGMGYRTHVTVNADYTLTPKGSSVMFYPNGTGITGLSAAVMNSVQYLVTYKHTSGGQGYSITYNSSTGTFGPEQQFSTGVYSCTSCGRINDNTALVIYNTPTDYFCTAVYAHLNGFFTTFDGGETINLNQSLYIESLVMSEKNALVLYKNQSGYACSRLLTFDFVTPSILYDNERIFYKYNMGYSMSLGEDGTLIFSNSSEYMSGSFVYFNDMGIESMTLAPTGALFDEKGRLVNLLLSSTNSHSMAFRDLKNVTVPVKITSQSNASYIDVGKINTIKAITGKIGGLAFSDLGRPVIIKSNLSSYHVLVYNEKQKNVTIKFNFNPKSVVSTLGEIGKTITVKVDTKTLSQAVSFKELGKQVTIKGWVSLLDSITSLDGFVVERKVGSDGTWTEIGSVASDIRTYADTSSFTNGVSYFYRLKRVSGGAESPYSNEYEVIFTTVQGVPSITLISYTLNKVSDEVGKTTSTVTFVSDKEMYQWEARADGTGAGQGDLVGSSGGSGTVIDPYIIRTATDLDNMRNNLTAHYRLANDIDLSGVADWVAFNDTDVNPFTGSLDGAGYKILNLTTTHSGLFDNSAFGSSSAVIKNIGLENANVYGATYAGGIIGWNRVGVHISNCYVTGQVESGNNQVGGIVGYNGYTTGGVVTDCYNFATIIGNATTGIGGVVGRNYTNGQITRCYNAGLVKKVDNTTYTSGGILGFGTTGVVTDCYWDTQTSGQSTSIGGGTGLTTAQMKVSSNFSNWDFVNSWGIDTLKNNGYPYLRINENPIANILSANQNISFDVDYNELKWGDKDYRINVYGRNINGWTAYEQ